jgi:hypothetical protein
MATQKAFDRYEIKIYGGNAERVGLLQCFAGESFVGNIEFYPDSATLPQDYLWHPNGIGEWVCLFMPMSRFESVLSTVRFEKPLQLYIDVNRGIGARTPGQGYLTTGEREPVGEQEGVP